MIEVASLMSRGSLVVMNMMLTGDGGDQQLMTKHLISLALFMLLCWMKFS